MSNGKFALAVKEAAKEEGIKVRIKKHREAVSDWDALSPKIGIIQNAVIRFFGIPFAIFVGFLEFFSAGFEASLRKALEMYQKEGGK